MMLSQDKIYVGIVGASLVEDAHIFFFLYFGIFSMSYVLCHRLRMHTLSCEY